MSRSNSIALHQQTEEEGWLEKLAGLDLAEGTYSKVSGICGNIWL
jgi:hypothetical protein